MLQLRDADATLLRHARLQAHEMARATAAATRQAHASLAAFVEACRISASTAVGHAVAANERHALAVARLSRELDLSRNSVAFCQPLFFLSSYIFNFCVGLGFVHSWWWRMCRAATPKCTPLKPKSTSCEARCKSCARPAKRPWRATFLRCVGFSSHRHCVTRRLFSRSR